MAPTRCAHSAKALPALIGKAVASNTGSRHGFSACQSQPAAAAERVQSARSLHASAA